MTAPIKGDLDPSSTIYNEYKNAVSGGHSLKAGEITLANGKTYEIHLVAKNKEGNLVNLGQISPENLDKIKALAKIVLNIHAENGHEISPDKVVYVDKKGIHYYDGAIAFHNEAQIKNLIQHEAYETIALGGNAFDEKGQPQITPYERQIIDFSEGRIPLDGIEDTLFVRLYQNVQASRPSMKPEDVFFEALNQFLERTFLDGFSGDKKEEIETEMRKIGQLKSLEKKFLRLNDLASQNRTAMHAWLAISERMQGVWKKSHESSVDLDSLAFTYKETGSPAPSLLPASTDAASPAPFRKIDELTARLDPLRSLSLDELETELKSAYAKRESIKASFPGPLSFWRWDEEPELNALLSECESKIKVLESQRKKLNPAAMPEPASTTKPLAEEILDQVSSLLEDIDKNDENYKSWIPQKEHFEGAYTKLTGSDFASFTQEEKYAISSVRPTSSQPAEKILELIEVKLQEKIAAFKVEKDGSSDEDAVLARWQHMQDKIRELEERISSSETQEGIPIPLENLPDLRKKYLRLGNFTDQDLFYLKKYVLPHFKTGNEKIDAAAANIWAENALFQ